MLRRAERKRTPIIVIRLGDGGRGNAHVHLEHDSGKWTEETSGGRAGRCIRGIPGPRRGQRPGSEDVRESWQGCTWISPWSGGLSGDAKPRRCRGGGASRRSGKSCESVLEEQFAAGLDGVPWEEGQPIEDRIRWDDME